jgi:hypothetical protein
MENTVGGAAGRRSIELEHKGSMRMKVESASFTIATAVIVLASAVAGPGLRSAGAQPVPCPGASCDVVVTVTGTPPGPVVVAASDIRMEKQKRNVMITWKLADDANFEFRPGSIKAHAGAAVNGKPTTTQAAWNAQCQFQSTNGKQYKVKNRNDVKTTLAYDITVYHKATGTPYTLDPVIFNDP